MVIPTDSLSSSCAKNKKYVGNDQTINLRENRSIVKIIGNGCVLKIKNNEGCVKVIGDDCKVTVCGGSGSISYVGNRGKLRVGLDVQTSKISYTGSDGTIAKIGVKNEDTPIKTSPKFENAPKNVNFNGSSLTIANSKHIKISYYDTFDIPLFQNLKKVNII